MAALALISTKIHLGGKKKPCVKTTAGPLTVHTSKHCMWIHSDTGMHKIVTHVCVRVCLDMLPNYQHVPCWL